MTALGTLRRHGAGRRPMTSRPWSRAWAAVPSEPSAAGLNNNNRADSPLISPVTAGKVSGLGL